MDVPNLYDHDRWENEVPNGRDPERPEPLDMPWFGRVSADQLPPS